MAQEVVRAAHDVPIAYLDLDTIAWSVPAVRKPLEESIVAIDAFVTQNDSWVVEGCYADLLEILAPHATEIRFLNPGTDTCVANCSERPWEPHKYESKAAQDATLAFLVDWVRQYDVRTDEYSLARHRAIFGAFEGLKHEYDGR